MKIPSIFNKIADLLVAPSLPARALSINESSLVFVALRHRGGEYESTRAGVVNLPPGLIRTGFEQPNIQDEARFREQLDQLADQVGIRRMGRLSVALPPGSARTFVISLDSVPSSKTEMMQLVDWKVERAIGYPLEQLRISRHRLSDLDGLPHWLIGVVHQSVISQYESVFNRLGWRAGLITPRAIGEASWLLRDKTRGDHLLVSVNVAGFQLIVIRAGEPILIRDVECAPGEVENEFYRLMIYYRDRLNPEGASPRMDGILTIGTPADQQFFRDLVTAALEQSVVSLSASQVGLKLDPGFTLQQLAAPAGLAALAR
ncbi:MAG: hypothetical protein ACOYLF_17245 [Blastocatellia bacterium]